MKASLLGGLRRGGLPCAPCGRTTPSARRGAGRRSQLRREEAHALDALQAQHHVQHLSGWAEVSEGTRVASALDFTGLCIWNDNCVLHKIGNLAAV